MKILFYRNREGIGDIAMMVRSIELTRLKYPKSDIIVQCRYPNLLMYHPAIDKVADLNVLITEYDILINYNTCCSDYESSAKRINKSRHQLFCESATKQLVDGNKEAIQWDGISQSLWISQSLNKWATNFIQNASNDKISIGVFGKSAQAWKSYSHIKALLKLLIADKDLSIFYFDAEEELLLWGIHQIIGYSLDKVLALVSGIDMIISADSAGLHLAGSFNIPAIGLFGPTDPLLLTALYQQMTWIQPIKCSYHPCWYHHCAGLSCLQKIKPRQIYSMVYRNKDTIKQMSEKRIPNIVNAENKLYVLPKKLSDSITISNKPDENKHKIVIVRMKGIGDVLMTWFGLDVLRKEYPESHITYITSRYCADLFHGQKELVDKVVVSSWDYPPKGIPKLPFEISNMPADKLIDLTNRVDFHDTIEKSLGDRKLLHTSPRANNFAKLMGISLDEVISHRMINIPGETAEWAYKIITQNGLSNQKLVCCQLDAQGTTRKWHIDRWVQLSELLIEKDYSVIWFSITPEHRMIDLSGVLNFSCQTSLVQMMALMAKCQYAISTCSASIHIAHRLPNVVPIGIYGSTDYKLLATYYDDLIPVTNYEMDCAPCADWGHECLGQPGEPWCINQINPQRIIRIMEEQ
ncbi:MAG: glycosyltransferase family 9 protein [Bacteroidetes bacterium]|nr:glycosyltransferase family 9 protein [Bacteroidota bacterium]